MSAFLVPSTIAAKKIASISSVAVTGTVRNAADSPLSRLVVIFCANNLANPLGVVRSSSVDGSFSFTVSGTVTTEFACVVQGEAGENCVVHSHKQAG